MKKNFNIVNIRQGKGFTILEILMVITLIGILIVITVPLAANIVNRTELNSAHESLYNSILRAQNLSKIQSRNQQWRVCIDNTAKQYIIAAGTCSSPLYAETIKFSSNITVSSTQTLDLQFTSPKGELNYAGNFSKISLNGGGVSKSIIVNQNGVIDKAATSDPSNTTATPSIVTDGLVLHLDSGNIGSYPGSGNTWFDLSGNGNNLTWASPAPTFTTYNGVKVISTTPIYTSLRAVRSTTYNGMRTATGSYTVFSFFRPNQITAAKILLSFGPANNNCNGENIHPIGINSFGKFSGGSCGGLGTWGSGSGGVTPTTTRFWCVATTYDGTTEKVYVDGSLEKSASSFTNSTPVSSTNAISLGWIRDDGASYSMDASIGNILIYNRALTASEIEQNFNATKGRFGL